MAVYQLKNGHKRIIHTKLIARIEDSKKQGREAIARLDKALGDKK